MFLTNLPSEKLTIILRTGVDIFNQLIFCSSLNVHVGAHDSSMISVIGVEPTETKGIYSSRGKMRSHLCSLCLVEPR